MSVNLSTGHVGRKPFSEEIVSIQGPQNVGDRAKVRKQEKPEPPQQVLGQLTKPEIKQVQERFEPLPPVLQKALGGNQSLKREFQQIERLTQPSPEPPPSAPRAPEVKREVPLAQAPVHPGGEGKFPPPAERPSLIPREVPKAPPLGQSQPQPPAGKPVPAAPIQGKGKGLESQPPPQISAPAPPKELKGAPGPLAGPGPLEVHGSKSVPPAAPSHHATPAGPKVQTSREAPPAPAPARQRDLVKEAVIQSVFSPKVLAPQTAVQITDVDKTSSTVTIGSKTVAPSPVVMTEGRKFPIPKDIQEESRVQFMQVLREAATRNFPAAIREAALLREVHPLPLPKAQEPAPLPALAGNNGVPEKPFPVETVARNPLHGDNGAQIPTVQAKAPQAEAPRIVNRPHEDQGVGQRQTPPLARWEPPQRHLPTDVRSKLVPVHSVNILDLTL